MLEDQLRHALQFADGHVRFGEAKNAAIFAAAGATAVAAVSLLLSEPGLSRIVAGYTTMTAALSVVAAVISVISFLPRTQLPWLGELEQPSDTDNLLFFGHIQKYSAEGYCRAVAGFEAKHGFSRLELCLSEQTVINSRIASRKFTLFRYSAWTFLAALITPVGAWLLSRYMQDPNI